MSVHSVLRESLRFGNISVPVRTEWTTSRKLTASGAATIVPTNAVRVVLVERIHQCPADIISAG